MVGAKGRACLLCMMVKLIQQQIERMFDSGQGMSSKKCTRRSYMKRDILNNKSPSQPVTTVNGPRTRCNEREQ